MKKLLIVIVLFIPLCLSGCVTYKYEGSKIPSLTSSNYPEFGPLTEIPYDLKYNFSEGSFKNKARFDMTVSIRGQSFWLHTITEEHTKRRIDKDLYYVEQSSDDTIQMEPAPIEKSNRKIEGVFQTNGKKVKMDGLFNGKLDSKLTDAMEKAISDGIRKTFQRIGKPVKVGEEFWGTSAFMSQLGESLRSQFKDLNLSTWQFSESVKGLSIYNNNKVIVTELTFELNLNDRESSLFELKMKGFQLYDANTFLPVIGRSIVYMTIFSPEIGTIHGKGNMTADYYDVQLTNIIGSPILEEKQTNVESSASWNEASDKIKALGELLQKGLITKEEYDIKKNELLKKF